MDIKEQKLAVGCLLHDFGKLLYRYNDGRNHSVSGYEYLKNTDLLKNESEVLDCIRYHHGGLLKNAKTDNSAICYITYIADNIASSERRKKDDGESGFVRGASLESVFNILNGNSEKKVYAPSEISYAGEINYPTDDVSAFDEEFYSRIVNNIMDALKGISLSDKYINSLLQVLEANLIFVPSSTNMGELRDISLYDHVKLTAAIGLCIKQYLDEKGITDYRTALFEKAESFYAEKAFRLYSLDMSGIQDFIYNIISEGALKGLRSRSFYLEILMEDIADELLKRIGLCRANILYTGGGHTYILVSATQKTAEIISAFEKELNQWFVSVFSAELSISGGYCDCSANDIKNKPDGSYKQIFSNVSKQISSKKLSKYSAEDIIRLNDNTNKDSRRECRICHRSDRLDNDNECIICSALKKISDSIISQGATFFAAEKDDGDKKGVPLPFGCVLTACGKDTLLNKMKENNGYVRAYSKNRGYTGLEMESDIWVGNYAAKTGFSELIKQTEGIKRLGVIRADVDNLGQSFVSGFAGADNSGKYETITRTSVFSRNLSMYFKLYINKLLKDGQKQLYKDKPKGARNAVIVYSGGDDLFIVGGWDDIIGIAVDLYYSFKRFTQGTLTFSAGIGIFDEKFPVAAMAEQTGTLEAASKAYKNEIKNSVTLFDEEEGSYTWDEFIDKVLGEKLAALSKYIDDNGKHAKAMLYKMLQLIRERKKEDRLNIARFAYLLARLEPDNKKATAEEIAAYKEFSRQMYRWIQNEEDCRQLITAIYIYIYLNREREE